MPLRLSQQNKESLLFSAIHLQLQNEKKKNHLSFPGRVAYNNTWMFTASGLRREAALTTREQS